MHDVTDLLVRVSQGEANALDGLVPYVYDELRSIARAHMRSERDGHTLTPTALVHEAYVRLAEQRRLVCRNRREFFAVASTLMRRVLVSHARRRLAQKRGGGLPTILLDSDVGKPITIDELLTIDETLNELGKKNPRLPVVVDLMFFGGFTQQEVSDLLQVSVSTVKRDWRLSRAWLSHQLSAADGPGP